MEKRAVIHIDLDAFFASVELKKRPELKGKPVIVGADGDPSKRGVVSAASYEAREFGVSSGMPLKKAKAICPEAVFLPVDFHAYEEESEKFMAILRDYSPLVESFGLDEAFIEPLTEEGKDPFGVSLDIAREIKKRVKAELKLSSSIGIAPNKLLAKLACDMNKPDGFTVIREKEIEKTLRDLPVKKLLGIGPKTSKRLGELGIRTIGELAKVPRQFLERNFGPNFGKTLYEHARGIDDSPVVPFYEPESMSREVTFQEDVEDRFIIKETLYALASDLTEKLKNSGYKARTFTIKVRYSDFKTITRSLTVEDPTESFNDIWRAVSGLVEKLEFPKMVRLVGVKLGSLSSKKGL